MKRKIMIDCGEVGFWEIEDITDYYEDIKEIKGEEGAKEYFRAGVFKGENLKEYNGKHFIYRYMESLSQSERCPSFLYDNEVKIRQIVVEEVKEKDSLVKCKTCSYCIPDLEKFPKRSFTCRKGKRDLEGIEKIEEVEVECDSFRSKYIEYPLTIHGIEKNQEKGLRTSYRGESGTLVKIRPCADEYGNKTYLGLLLGEVDVGLMVSLDESSNHLCIHRHFNPAILVPELKKVIYGYESWWGVIQNEEELKEITKEEIDNVWYVRLLKDMMKNKKTEESNI